MNNSTPANYSRRKESRYTPIKDNSKGVIESFTKVWSAPEDFESQVPYYAALIKIEGGKKIIAQVVDSDEIKIGSKVEACLRQLYSDGESGIITYGTKFKVIK